MEVKYYVDKSGKSPFDEWLESIKDKSIQNRLLKEITKLELGLLGDPKSVGGGLYEKRIKFSTAYRIYYGYHNKEIIILLSGSSKDGQKKEIKKAHEYWDDFKKRQTTTKGGMVNEKSK